jgi:hypothetical protein
MKDQIRDEGTRTRGHSAKLQKQNCRLNIRKFSFTNRIVDIWNSLPQEVISSKPVRQFESNLDSFWEKEEMKYDFTANIVPASGSHVKSRHLIFTTEADIVAE